MFDFIACHRRRQSARGFTMIELVVVLAILGILLALAVPQYLGYRKRGYKEEINNVLQEAKTLSWAYYQEHDVFPATLSDIGLQMPGGTVWDTPVSSGGGSSAFITWTASGLPGGAPVEPADLCSVTMSNHGGSAAGCTF